MRIQRAMIGPMMASASVSASGTQATVGNQTMSCAALHGRHAEQARHQGGDGGHQDDPQILHEGDQARIGAVVLGHDGHHRGGPGAGAPQRRRAGHHLPARHQPAEQARGDDDQHDARRRTAPSGAARRRRSTRAPCWRSGSRRRPGPARRAATGSAPCRPTRQRRCRRSAAPASGPPARGSTAGRLRCPPTGRSARPIEPPLQACLKVYWANSSASPFMPRIVARSSTAAAASRASSVPRSTSETLGLPLRKAG